MTTQEEYRRATSVNLSDEHETRKVPVVRVRLSRTEKWIYVAMAVVLIYTVAVDIAAANGWI